MKKFLKVVGINILVLIIFLLLFEVGLRLFWEMSALKVKEGLYQRSPNRILRYELKPNLKTMYAGHELATNSEGFRGPEYSIQKEKNTYRVIFIGDSVAFGKFVSFEDTLSHRLELGLSHYCPQREFEVFNMGIEGYNSTQELELLRTKGLKYNPDLVIVYYCLNDPDYPEYYFKKNFINRHFLLTRYILYRVKKHWVKTDRRKRGFEDISGGEFNYFYSMDCWQYAKEAILKMGDLCASRGIKMVLLIVPEMSDPVKDFKEGYPFWYINDMLEAVEHDNIIVIDPIREFSRRNLSKDEVRVWNYPNLKANNIISEYTLKKLQEHNINLCN